MFGIPPAPSTAPGPALYAASINCVAVKEAGRRPACCAAIMSCANAQSNLPCAGMAADGSNGDCPGSDHDGHVVGMNWLIPCASMLDTAFGFQADSCSI